MEKEVGEPAVKSRPSIQTPAKGRLFSADLRALVERFEGRAVSLQDLLAETQGRGFHLLLLLIALPFVGPIPLPGFSIPFGLLVTILGCALAVGHKPWLPQVFLQRELPARFMGKVLRGTTRIMEMLEHFLRPRLGFVDAHLVFSRVAGFFIAVSGLMLMLPFPLPFSNSLPAWTVLFLAAGALAHDGLFFLIGCGSFVLSVAFFTMVAVGGTEALRRLVDLVTRG
jgi:hypothetical protein